MTTIKDLLKAVVADNLEVSIYSNPIDKSVTIMLRKHTGDIISKVGHQFTKDDLSKIQAFTLGSVVNSSIEEVVDNHKKTLEII